MYICSTTYGLHIASVQDIFSTKKTTCFFRQLQLFFISDLCNAVKYIFSNIVSFVWIYGLIFGV